jgi:acetyl-CoA C-acetyltransferase
LGRAGARQLDNPRMGLTHNLGGWPYSNICAITVVGKYGS